jgi:hypothetical protein
MPTAAVGREAISGESLVHHRSPTSCSSKLGDCTFSLGLPIPISAVVQRVFRHDGSRIEAEFYRESVGLTWFVLIALPACTENYGSLGESTRG